ncbi:MAG: DedA family protein [Candidatus Cloacimonetes bacterium]|nr:DedA family protein [Candidatus Cloacimonadota bacterium]
MFDFLQQYGFWALLLISFIAATIFPLSSEAAMIASIVLGLNWVEAVIACSIGNCLAVSFNYMLGAIAGKPLLPRLEKSRGGRKARFWVEKYGIYSLWLSWTPILGDPITIAAGVFRLHLLKYILIVFSLRIFRYAIVGVFLG